VSEDVPGMRNRFVGEAHNVLQARDVHGGIHYHGVRGSGVKPPCHVLPPPQHYTNNQRQLDELTQILTDGCSGDGPKVALIRGAPGSGRTTLATAWVYQHRSDFPDGQLLVRLAAGDDGAEREREALGDILAEVGFDQDEIPASLDGRVAWWRSWSASRRVAVVVDDALLPRQVDALLPGRGSSVVLAVEAGRLSALRARVSAKEVKIDPLSTESALGGRPLS
jgi:hypothetical protein